MIQISTFLAKMWRGYTILNCSHKIHCISPAHPLQLHCFNTVQHSLRERAWATPQTVKTTAMSKRKCKNFTQAQTAAEGVMHLARKDNYQIEKEKTLEKERDSLSIHVSQLHSSWIFTQTKTCRSIFSPYVLSPSSFDINMTPQLIKHLDPYSAWFFHCAAATTGWLDNMNVQVYRCSE